MRVRNHPMICVAIGLLAAVGAALVPAALAQTGPTDGQGPQDCGSQVLALDLPNLDGGKCPPPCTGPPDGQTLTALTDIRHCHKPCDPQDGPAVLSQTNGSDKKDCPPPECLKDCSPPPCEQDCAPPPCTQDCTPTPPTSQVPFFPSTGSMVLAGLGAVGSVVVAVLRRR